MRKEYPNGLTIRELKKLLEGWSEEYEDGEETTVWVGYDAISSLVTRVWTLDLENGRACILLERE